jgi:hypothetical protein
MKSSLKVKKQIVFAKEKVSCVYYNIFGMIWQLGWLSSGKLIDMHENSKDNAYCEDNIKLHKLRFTVGCMV